MTNLHDTLAEAIKQGEAAQSQTYSLNDYIELIRKNPTIAVTAHTRIRNMIFDAGHGPGAVPEETSWKFFTNQIFGMDVPLTRITRYFDSAAQGHETKRRILLLWGPPGGAKSSVVDLLKRGLEEYTRTDKGAVYALKNCPMHEEPLHLVPRQYRQQVLDETGINIERSLCPVCRYRLQEDFGGDFLSFPIERIFFDEDARVGIGTFEPGDPKSQSMEQLTGGVDYAKIAEYGSEAHPMALDWAGEFSKSNRGIFEAVEFFKNPAEFRNAFLTLGQEKKFKPPKFGYIDWDGAIIAHTNEAEFRAFMADEKNEALKSRIITVEQPYNVRIEDEVKIYHKLLTTQTAKFHIAPHTLDTAAFVAVLSRLKEHDGLDLVQKAKLYNGEETGEWKTVMIPELKRAAEHEGMAGIGPREVINALSTAAVEQTRKGAAEPYLTPIIALIAAMDWVDHSELPKETRDRYRKFVIDARNEMDRELKDEIRKAFIPAFGNQAQNILENYLTNVESFLTDVKVIDPITHEAREPDEKLMRAIEEKVTPSVPDTAKDTFRQGVFVRLGMALKGGRPLNYKTDQQLGKAIEAHLFDEMKDIIRITVSKHNPDPEQAKRLNEVTRVLTEERGYSNESARDVLEYIGELMNR